MNAAEITDKLGLHSLRHRNWYIQATCATSGDGLYEGLDWLSNQLKNAKWSIPPSRLLSALCVYECVKGDSTGFSLTRLPSLFIYFSRLVLCTSEALPSAVWYTRTSACVCVYVCVCIEGGSSLAVPFKIDTQRTARFSFSLLSLLIPMVFCTQRMTQDVKYFCYLIHWNKTIGLWDYIPNV